MTVLNIEWVLLLSISFGGYFWWFRAAWGLEREFVPVCVFSTVGLAAYFAGLLRVLKPGAEAILMFGLLLGGYYVFRSFHFERPVWRIYKDASGHYVARRLRRRKKFSYFFPSLFETFFLLGTIAFFVLLSHGHLTHYDNFSHWAIVLKQILSTNAFPTASSDLIDFKNYPLGTASFLYYICLFAGHAQLVMIAAQNLLIFSAFYALFGIITEKKRFLLYAFLALGCSVLSVFNLTIRINNLLVDFLLPLYALVMLAMIYRYRADLCHAFLAVVPVAGLLTVIKSTGIVFVAVGWVYLIYTWLHRRGRPFWKGGLYTGGTVLLSALPYMAWSWHMAVDFQKVQNKFSTTVGNLGSIRTTKNTVQIHKITALFIRAAFDLSTRPAMGILVFNGLAVVASVFAIVVLNKKWKLWKALIALDVVIILYYLGILALYIFSMPLSEALTLAGFDRYASSIVVLFAGGLVLCATVDIENSLYYHTDDVPSYLSFKTIANKQRYQQGIIACMAVAIVLLMSEYNGLLSIQNTYPSTLPYRVEAVTGDRWYQGGREDQSRYLFYTPDTDGQVTDYYLQYVAKYFLYAPHVDGIVLFYEPNMDHLLSQYDYLVIVEGDADARFLLQKHYGVTGTDGIYRIMRLGDTVSLTPVRVK